MPNRVERSDQDWRELLGPERFAVLREGATERAFTGELLGEHRDGTFCCGGCGAALFASDAKYDSGSGWPSFDAALSDGVVATREDTSHGMRRTEILCAACGGHLGHVFPDGPPTTGLRYCVNSLSLSFSPET